MKTETSVAKYYGVSTGNGNDGVSQMHPNYIVKTDDPWALAKRAALSEFKPEFQEWAKENMELDGDSQYGISAMFLESYDQQKEREEAQEKFDNGESEDNPKNWDNGLGVWFIVEVFPITDDLDGYYCPKYDSIEEAL